MYITGKTSQEKAKDAYRIVLTDKGPYRAMGHQVVRAATFDSRSKRLRTRSTANARAINDN
jgi:hypothetical protein